MNRGEFILATAIVLFVAFSLGWFACWLVHRFTRVGQADISELDRMASALHEAEEQREEAIAYVHAREAEMASRQAQLEAELGAAMDGLRGARREAADLRGYIEKVNAG